MVQQTLESSIPDAKDNEGQRARFPYTRRKILESCFQELEHLTKNTSDSLQSH